jgi:proteic killer suppression protein
MEIMIPDKKFKRAIEDDTECRKRFGTEMAKKIGLRMAALRAAESLADFWPPYSGPERCHELKGDLAGIISVDLKHPYRLLFKCVDVTTDAAMLNEKQRWQAIRAIEILSVVDTHG